MKLNEKKCSKCALVKNNKCLVKKMEISTIPCICEFYCEFIETCEKCKSIITAKNLIYSNGKIICDSCASYLGTCYWCENFIHCAFEEDTSGLPKKVSKQIQQGPQIFVTVTKNPEIVRKTCQNGCKCYDAKNGCLREINQTCGNYHEVK